MYLCMQISHAVRQFKVTISFLSKIIIIIIIYLLKTQLKLTFICSKHN